MLAGSARRRMSGARSAIRSRPGTTFLRPVAERFRRAEQANPVLFSVILDSVRFGKVPRGVCVTDTLLGHPPVPYGRRTTPVSVPPPVWPTVSPLPNPWPVIPA